jgi:hypothetical protein
VRQKIILGASIVIAVFLAGFVPQYARASRLQNELRRAQEAASFADLRSAVALAYVQANEKNYGLAAGTSARFFNRAHELASQAQDETRKGMLESLLAPRDRITAELAKGDAAAIGDLGQLFRETERATGAGPGER